MVSWFSFCATRHILTNFGGHLHTNIHSQLHQVFSLWFWCRARQSRWVTAEWQKRTTGSCLPLVPALSRKPKDIASVKRAYGGPATYYRDYHQTKLSPTGLLLKKIMHNIIKQNWLNTHKWTSPKHLLIYNPKVRSWKSSTICNCQNPVKLLQRPIPGHCICNDSDPSIHWMHKYNFHFTTWLRGKISKISKISITQWVTGWMSFPLKKHMERGWFKNIVKTHVENLNSLYNQISYVKCNLL